MCGRFNIEFDDDKEIGEIITKVDEKVRNNMYPSGYQMKRGDIYPTNIAPILKKEKESIEPELSCWGFPNYKNKGVIINARSETAFQKNMFRTSLISRRCIIPSTGFYEWDKDKRKYFIRRPDTNALYMAGVYNYFNEESRFVILTTAANSSMETIHDRMPVILKREELKSWLFDDDCANDLMSQAMPELKLNLVQPPFEQMTLF